MTDAAMLRDIQDQLAAVEHRLQAVEDRDAIYSLFLELQKATDGRDKDKYAACFTEDGEWSGVSGRAVGRAEITEIMGRIFKPWASENERTYHSISDVEIDLDGDRATARVVYRHIKLENDLPVTFHLGHYDAVLERAAEGWRFKRRASYLDLPYFEPKFQLIGLAADGNQG
ncbi:nuclear transport factor 2 family protein [Sphingobium nicotianae]|uniref:Nuclear transport factor 2 family protein n=1 Tax=Sphingobium nicotianae TaxID=2782607 RepID=A0A9X1DAB8_9SPHN|nr:nuclear transport factor 2 family protein [Sphingobium nicotianae]MBT2186332.1 nuclear transport factor 2 family protein [Sphingobium nicotianae]